MRGKRGEEKGNEAMTTSESPVAAEADEADGAEIPFVLELGSIDQPIYTPLNTEKSEVRLLYINEQSCCTCHEICCDLYKVSSDDNPSYAALSYCWGNTDDKVEICLTGRPLAVPRSLVNALKRLKETPEDYFWIDAVCINLEDVEERGSQINLMTDIYGCAMTVYSYLNDDQQPEPIVWSDDDAGEIGNIDDGTKVLDMTRRSSLPIGNKAKSRTQFLDEGGITIAALDLAYCSTVFNAEENEAPEVDPDDPTDATENAKTVEPIVQPAKIIPPPEYSTVDLALFWCNIIYEQLQDQNSENSVPPNADGSPTRIDGMPVLVNDAITPIINLMRNRYWQRVWIFQEMVLAEELTFLGPRTSLTTAKFEAVCNWLRDIEGGLFLKPDFLEWRQWSLIKQRLQFTELHPLVMRSCRDLADKIDRDEQSIAELAGPRDQLFQHFRRLRATEPHDHIYGILGVLQVHFRVDYTRTVRDLYIAWCRWLARSQQDSSFQFLDQAGIGRDDGNPHQLPSWVPDWSSPRSIGGYSSSKSAAAAGILGHYVVKANGSLHLDGIVVDTILPRRRNGKNLFLQYYHHLRLHGDPTGDPPLQILYRVLTGDGHAAYRKGAYDQYDPRLAREFLSFATLLQNSDDETFLLLEIDPITWSPVSWALNEYFGLEPDAGDRWNPLKIISGEVAEDDFSTLTTGDQKMDDVLNSILNCSMETFELLGDDDSLLSQVMQKACFFRSKQGYIGNSGPAVRAGDLVCVLAGCSQPAILRRIDNHYILVGTAFVHGLMYGEAKTLLDEGTTQLERFEIH